LISDVLVPVLQAAISGALLAALLVFVVSEVAPGFGGDLLKVWAITALAITAGAWLLLLGQTRRLLWTVERLTGQDLNRNGVIGKPQERLVIVNAAKSSQQSAQAENQERAEGFRDFVELLDVRGTDLRAWEKRIGRETYQAYRDALIRLGWARWRSVAADGTPNTKQGWELTAEPSWILDRIN
jgi:hypothetical protein